MTGNKVLLNTYERNGYHDSDGIALVLNRAAKKLERIVYWTTRGHVSGDQLEGVDRSPTRADFFRSMRIIRNELLSKNMPEQGDNVVISRGRKYPKGTVFKIDRFSNYRDHYGRVQTVYAHDKAGSIKVNCNNIDLTSIGRSLAFGELTRR